MQKMKNPFSRRRFIQTSTLAAGAGLTLENLLPAVAANISSPDDPGPSSAANYPVILKLIDREPFRLAGGVSFGVPWPKGSVKRGATFNLTAGSKQLPLQTWPLAFWPDG